MLPSFNIVANAGGSKKDNKTLLNNNKLTIGAKLGLNFFQNIETQLKTFCSKIC